jgi:hypothetical protein
MLEVTYAVKSTVNFVGTPVEEHKHGFVCEEADKRGNHWITGSLPVKSTDVLDELNRAQLARLRETGSVIKYFYGLEITITKLN